MSLFATERVPQPAVIDAVVSNDVIARTLTVRLSDAAGGYEKSLWLQAHQQLRAAEQSGSRGQQPTVWASAVGASRLLLLLILIAKRCCSIFSPALPLTRA